MCMVLPPGALHASNTFSSPCKSSVGATNWLDSSWMVITPSSNKACPAKWPWFFTNALGANSESSACNNCFNSSLRLKSTTRTLALFRRNKLSKMAKARFSPYSSIMTFTNQTGREYWIEYRLFLRLILAISATPSRNSLRNTALTNFSLPFFRAFDSSTASLTTACVGILSRYCNWYKLINKRI